MKPKQQERVDEYRARIIAVVNNRRAFVLGDDGYMLYWPNQDLGAHTARDLRILADELDRINTGWDRKIKAAQ